MSREAKIATLDDLIDVLRHYGDWAHGFDAEGAARNWLYAGFSPAEAEAWLEAGVFSAGAAWELRGAGLEPGDVAEPYNERGLRGNSLGYWVANRDISVADAVRVVLGRTAGEEA